MADDAPPAPTPSDTASPTTTDPEPAGLLSPALVIGGGCVAVEVTRRLKAEGYDVSAVACGADGEALEAAGATLVGGGGGGDAAPAAVASHKAVFIADELGQLLTLDQNTAIAAAAKEAGVELTVRLCMIGTGGGGWFRHRFGDAIVLSKHNAAVKAFEASGVPFSTVNAGVLLQTFAAWLGPVVKATSALPNMLGDASRMSFIHVNDVADTVVHLLAKRQAGKRLAMNGSRSATFPQLAAFLTMNAGSSGVTVDCPDATADDVAAQLKEHSGLGDDAAAEVVDLLTLASKDAFNSTSEDAKIVLGRREVMLDAWLKENVGQFVEMAGSK